MGVSLPSPTAAPASASETLTALESVEHNGSRYAVCEDASRALILAVERERGTVKDGKRDRANGTEKYWKRSAKLTDFAAALESGLIDLG